MYRIVQESLTNTLKHAGPATARVRVACGPGEAEVEVTDDGAPGPGRAAATSPAGTSAEPGHGIAGMAERAAMFGGTLTAGPRPGGGWRVHAVLRLGGTRPQAVQAVPAVTREDA